MARPKRIVMDDFYCTQCGNKGIPIPRQPGGERAGGHLKRLWCLHCKKETNHVECRPGTKYTYEDFLLERKYNNFNKDGTRKYEYGILRGLINNGKI
jgi:hypothetical protein